MKNYTATKSRSQGRSSFAVIFRHPARPDPLNPSNGRRVRRGLGTTDEVEADRLVAQLNELLKDSVYWEPSARAAAQGRYDQRVVDIFFDSMEASQQNSVDLRDQELPLPWRAEGYRRVLFLGTTGAGKTTVVRQILGTDPETERFPSTSTAKTTVADTELILTDDDRYRAVVTFVGRDEIVDYLMENLSEAALAAYRGKHDDEIARRLLDHVNQRFRFSYVLGRPVVDPDEELDEEGEIGGELDVTDFGQVDLEKSREIVLLAVAEIKTLVETFVSQVRDQLEVDESDERIIDEIIEENLDAELRQSEEFHQISDSILDEIELRFQLLDDGELRRNRQGWPVAWTYETSERQDFIRIVMRFASNYAPLFGRLLTPLVNGIRVSGPFSPSWSTERPRLVLMDGEGLGHTPNSLATLSTPVAMKIERVDAVLLVDNAANPMQAGPVAAMKALAAAGNGGKLFLLFTHFDHVKGDNLPRFSDREQHVFASVDNVLNAIGDELGPFAERSLRQRRDKACFFVGGIQELLDESKNSGRRSIAQLASVVKALETAGERVTAGPARPIYDRMNLSLAVTEATKSFHVRWRGLLGLEFNPAFPKEHWARVKALTRRLAEGWADEYAGLQPIANLRFELQLQVYLMLQQPIEWSGDETSEDDKQSMIDAFSNAVSNRLFALTERRLKEEVRSSWQDAYSQRGSGSTFTRARIISQDIYDRGAPIPTVAALPDQNSFLYDVAKEITAVATELNVDLR